MPKISVVIPTRNRLPYLQDCLQTALNQLPADMEIIVADNATTDGTREYLASLGDKVRTTRSEEPLAMSENWQRALDMVRGEWVIFIGDDDCLMPDFFPAAMSAIQAFPGEEILSWEAPLYRWPSSINEEERNYLIFTIRSAPQRMSSSHTLRKLYEEIVNIMTPPGLYHVLSRTSLIQKCKDRFGEFRLGKVPDLSSGLLYMATSESYVMLPRPLSLMAFGSLSTGMAYKNAKKDYGPRAEFARLTRMEDLAETYPLVDVDNPNIHQWRLLLDWQAYFKPRGVNVELNNARMLAYCINRLNVIPADDREEAARKFTEFAVSVGWAKADVDGMVQKAMVANRSFKPAQHVFKEGEITVLRLGADLTLTPIRTASQAAGLIYGNLPR